MYLFCSCAVAQLTLYCRVARERAVRPTWIGPRPAESVMIRVEGGPAEAPRPVVVPDFTHPLIATAIGNRPQY